MMGTDRVIDEKPVLIFLLCLIYAVHMVEEFTLGFVEWADRYFGKFNWAQNLIGNSIFMKAFVWVWRPAQYLRRDTAPLVLTLGFRQRNPSPRWKQVVEPYPGRFTHHLELRSAGEIDAEVRQWLQEAWTAAE